MQVIKRAIRRIILTAPMRGMIWVVMFAARIVARLMSEARARTLFPNAKELHCHWTAEVKYPENIAIGNDVSIGPYCCLGAHSPIVIEDFARLSRGVVLETAGLDTTAPLPYPHVSRPIFIGRGAWIGTNAIILGGVTVGADAVVGAGAVVTKDVSPGAVVIGVSAREVGSK